jgi:hypothetical protein
VQVNLLRIHFVLVGGDSALIQSIRKWSQQIPRDSGRVVLAANPLAGPDGASIDIMPWHRSVLVCSHRDTDGIWMGR